MNLSWSVIISILVNLISEAVTLESRLLLTNWTGTALSTETFSCAVFNFLTVLALAKSAYALVKPCSNLSRPTTSSSSVTLRPNVASITLNNTVVVTTTQAITVTTPKHWTPNRVNPPP